MPGTVSVPKMKVTLNCGVCQEPVLSDVRDGMSFGDPFSRSKTGNLKFGPHVIVKNVECPACHVVVIQLTGVGRGFRGTMSMTSVPTKPKPQEVAS